MYPMSPLSGIAFILKAMPDIVTLDTLKNPKPVLAISLLEEGRQ